MSDSSHKDLAAMPAALRTLLDAELAAGNTIIEVGHGFPAPPVGAYVKLSQPLRSRPQKSGDGIDYYDRNQSNYSGEITDAKRFYFLLEPPHPPQPEPDIHAIRAALEAKARAGNPVPVSPVQPVKTPRVETSRISQRTTTTPQDDKAKSPAVRRFEASMVMDFDKWHDGTGYDLEALLEMSPAERNATEAMLIRRGAGDWRDIEALACFETPAARKTLQAAINHSNPEIRNAVTRYAPDLISASDRTASLVQGLATGKFFHGLTQTLDEVEKFHPPLVVEALLRGALARDGEAAVHFAAMLFFIHGQATEAFDMEQRPFFLRFNTEDRVEREMVFREMCERIGVDPVPYLRNGGS